MPKTRFWLHSGYTSLNYLIINGAGEGNRFFAVFGGTECAIRTILSFLPIPSGLESFSPAVARHELPWDPREKNQNPARVSSSSSRPEIKPFQRVFPNSFWQSLILRGKMRVSSFSTALLYFFL